MSLRGSEKFYKIYYFCTISIIVLLIGFYAVSTWIPIDEKVIKPFVWSILLLMIVERFYQGFRGVFLRRIYLIPIGDISPTYLEGLPAFLLGLGFILFDIFLLIIGVPYFIQSL